MYQFADVAMASCASRAGPWSGMRPTAITTTTTTTTTNMTTITVIITLNTTTTTKIIMITATMHR